MNTDPPVIQPGESGQGSGGSFNACLPCRKVKMKCRITGHSTICDRCSRKSLHCLFQQHRRGRKLGMRLSSASAARSTDGGNGHAETSQSREAEDVNLEDHSDRSGSRKRFWNDPEGLQPPSLLNKQATRDFSLQNILSTSENTDEPSRMRAFDTQEDPIIKSLISHTIAMYLFEEFLKNFNPYINQLDPVLHTFEYVRSKSSFLLTALISVAAKALNRPEQSQLQDHAENLFLDAIRRGVKSVEVVQAIMLLTYRKTPDDTRVFVNVGIAIRIGIELGWHKLTLSPITRAREREIDLKTREARSIERTWLVLFVYDRSISMQTGKPFMIERNSFIDGASDVWYHNPLGATDGLLCAFVQLRLMTSDVVGMLHCAADDRHSPHPGVRPLLRVLKDQIARWMTRWVKATESEPRHSFMVKFYGNHTLLLLLSAPLRESLTSRTAPLDMEAFWESYCAAIAMLQLIADPTYSYCLFFVQDSFHVMLAYASVFLIKLLLSIPSKVRAEIEENTIETLYRASNVFSRQSAPVRSGCALQATFLANVCVMVEKICQRRRRNYNEVRRAVEPSPSVSHATQAELMDAINSMSGSHNGELEAESTRTDGGTSTITPRSQQFNFFDDDTWATMFISAGFDPQEGIFLPGFGE